MPRNGSGTSSVINTFVIDTVADPDEVNANFTDVADQLTNSLPRDGQAGMNAPLPLQNGTTALPALTFSTDTNTGLYRKAADTVAISGNGADIAVFSPTGVDLVGSLSGTFLQGYLYGLTLSNNSGDATNDIDIAVGAAADTTTYHLMQLTGALTKRLDAAWAVGTNQGGLDTGSIANAVYHVWLIQRSDTGVVDALFSTSATSPTMPTNYDRKRRIGSIIRSGATILAFTQDGDDFTLTTSILDVDVGTQGTTQVTRTLTVPTGIVVYAKIRILGSNVSVWTAIVRSSIEADVAPSFSAAPLGDIQGPGGNSGVATLVIRTDTSASVRTRASVASTTIRIATYGWIDKRGRV